MIGDPCSIDDVFRKIDARESETVSGPVRVTFEASSMDNMVGWAKSMLEDHGYEVRLAVLPMERPKALCERIGITVKTFSDRMRAAGRPQMHPGDIDRGPKGRINRIRPTGPLIEWLTAGK